MNLLHFADLHLGKRVNGFDLLPDQRYILEQVLDLCTAHNVQAVALAGDIYDTALPPAAAVLLLDWFLTELAHRNIPVLAIAGNHDSAERLDYAAGLLSNQQVYLAGQFTSAPRRVILQDEFGELTFDLLPFVRPATVRHCLPDADIRDEDSAIAAALGPLPTAGERRVLIAHQMVLGGGSLPTCSGSESVAADVNVGTVQAVDAARFTGYRCSCVSSPSCSSKTLVAPTMPVSGVRMSWDTARSRSAAPLCGTRAARCAIRWMSAAHRKAPFWFISGPTEPNRSFCPCARCTPCATSPARWTS